jgi:RNA-binding protein NOB1
LDNEEEGGHWITPDNLHKHIGAAVTVPSEVLKEELPDDGKPRFVQYLTSDYAMQNVIIQMGFKLLSLDGRRITRVKRFKLLCRACQRLNLNIEKLFCEFCGSHTLIKVSVYINQNGEITFFKNPRRKARLRGTKYTLPKPQGGRMGDGLILREDELMVGHKRIMVRQIAREKRVEQTAINDTLQGNYWAGGEGYGASVSNLLYENGAKGGRTHSKMSGMVDNIVIGRGRKNPNIVNKRTGNKK